MRQEDAVNDGEINHTLAVPLAAICRAEELYKSLAKEIDYTDGLSMESADWRVNPRFSNNELF